MAIGLKVGEVLVSAMRRKASQKELTVLRLETLSKVTVEVTITRESNSHPTVELTLKPDEVAFVELTKAAYLGGFYAFQVLEVGEKPPYRTKRLEYFSV